ncbi:hypothetical protein [Peribacillus frigoritolerans]|uniref:hypothetical protein n=1 Tax=Peribacillus frigoritolerans TaxID=450367 RepID=UPI0039A3CD18
MNKQRIPLTEGTQYGNFKAIQYEGKQFFGKTLRHAWLVQCNCGNQIIVEENTIRCEELKSCGCKNVRKLRKPLELGQKIGRLTVIAYSGKREASGRLRNFWEVECFCGNKIELEETVLKSDRKKSCGCLTTVGDLTGTTVGRLTVLGFSHTKPKKSQKKHQNYKYWTVACECGTVKTVEQSSLTRKLIKSCGCILKENARKRAEKRDRIEILKERLFKEYFRNAKKRDYLFNLTKEQFFKLIQQPCYYCGETDSNEATDYTLDITFKYNGVDRIDNHIGYEPDNVVSSCKHCNAAKSDLSKQDFLEQILKIYNHNL